MTTPASRWIDHRVDAALNRAFDQIDTYQRDGHCTEDDITQALIEGWGDAVADAWREYIGEEGA